MPETNATTSTLPQIKIVHVKPVELPPNFRLGDDTIDLMMDFSLSSAQAIGGGGRHLRITRLPSPSTNATDNGDHVARRR